MKRRNSDIEAQYFMAITIVLTLMIIAMLLAGCRSSNETIVTSSISTRSATPTECSTGGVVVDVGGTINVVCSGIQGAPGANGVDGQNGTSITVVQFCPGDTIYPSDFPEVGFIINGRLYAVYSANSGFLTMLQPGQYVSNAINSHCNFTVGADGVTITH